MTTLLGIIGLVVAVLIINAIPGHVWVGIFIVVGFVAALFAVAYILKIALRIFNGKNPFKND